MMLAEQPFLIGGATWIEVRDGNPTALSIFDRHYSSRRAHIRKIDQFVGPGEKMVLLTPCARAVFAWRRELYRFDGQTGINCSVFRNEGAGGGHQQRPNRGRRLSRVASLARRAPLHLCRSDRDSQHEPRILLHKSRLAAVRHV